VVEPSADSDAITRVLTAEGSSRREAVTDLRAAGPQALVAVLHARRQADPERTDVRWDALVDEVAQQRDASWSELFWYTGLTRAKAAAASSGRPILSLRLMGELTDEYSCANSRFFRTALYSHPEVARWLRSNFVLHWSSERPVPKVTVDFGDGRVLQRTVTGNSAHYVLDAEGRPIDVVPGLYGPDAFRDALEESLELHAALVEDPEHRERTLRRHHDAEVDEAVAVVHERLRGRRITRRKLRASMLEPQWVDTSAAAAAPRALSKAVVERRLVEEIGGEQVVMTTDGWWSVAGAVPARLHARSVELIAGERPDLEDVGELVRALEDSIALDTARNEYGLRVRIHAWFAAATPPDDFEALNARVYNELFLTPRDDAWLGLLERDVYTGLEHNGVTPAPAARQATR
jgi:hypothetical protein